MPLTFRHQIREKNTGELVGKKRRSEVIKPYGVSCQPQIAMKIRTNQQRRHGPVVPAKGLHGTTSNPYSHNDGNHGEDIKQRDDNI